jgi:hypothetical protein
MTQWKRETTDSQQNHAGIAHVKDMCGMKHQIVHDPEQGMVYPCPPDKVDIIKAMFQALRDDLHNKSKFIGM